MTPAIKLLQKHQVPHTLHRYEHQPSAASYGLEAAQKLGVTPMRVFKTLVVQGSDGDLAVAIVPVSTQLSLKMVAQALKTKKCAMAPADLVVRTTGYILGGVSPLAQKQTLQTLIDTSATHHTTVFVSAGQRGLEIEMSPSELIRLTSAKVVPISSPA